MKLFFALLILPMLASSQLIKNSGKKWNSKEILDKINDATVYFLDTTKISKSDLSGMNSEEIALITAYFENEPDLPTLFKGYLEHGAISLVTKPYAISKYRPELSRISNDYLELTKRHSPDRDSILYIVDGDTLKPNVEGKLFNLNFSKIETIQVIFPDEAQKSFGDKGRFGVVFVNPRKD